MIKYISIPYHYYVSSRLVVLAQGKLSAKKNMLLGEEDGGDWCAGEIAGEFMELYLSK